MATESGTGFKEELIQFFSKGGPAYVVFGVALGVVGKIGWMLMSDKQYTWRQAIGEAFISLFIGVVAGIIVWGHSMWVILLVVSISTYLSGKIAMVLMSFTVKEIKEWLLFMLSKK